MILTGQEICNKHKIGEIYISPFDNNNINPNSYNFHLGDYLKVYKNNLIDPKEKQEVEIINIPDEGIVLFPDKLYLGYTLETMGSTKYVPIMTGRSSTGRLGLFVHITADLIDIGSINQWTLQIHVIQPLKVYRNMPIGQVTFWKTVGDIVLYNGKYQGSEGPMESQIWKDFEENADGRFIL
ncbi:deoxycytidine triphosphate deaminase [Paenibacillus baekrokdamisoli]|uniref:Deoxycytidine triphosphate deaminase n=1 Tax=Paenibacillus baekrokdamisoli TaxID=1712516 RepID=A0A3G9JCC7_9BACL|nr:dCTP deaminase [Paenibacillus baekrokdamisoli]MBB3068372.1 dCTP deaminase [Paenibacillus baekrokdamisoli]BBH22583.1 deoxycytidine triphosphate deaminase [Paenibacillus baekrokdamisoli]